MSSGQISSHTVYISRPRTKNIGSPSRTTRKSMDGKMISINGVPLWALATQQTLFIKFMSVLTRSLVTLPYVSFLSSSPYLPFFCYQTSFFSSSFPWHRDHDRDFLLCRAFLNDYNDDDIDIDIFIYLYIRAYRNSGINYSQTRPLHKKTT